MSILNIIFNKFDWIETENVTSQIFNVFKTLPKIYQVINIGLSYYNGCLGGKYKRSNYITIY